MGTEFEKKYWAGGKKSRNRWCTIQAVEGLFRRTEKIMPYAVNANICKGDDFVECPVCGKYKFAEENSFDICPICSWENDGVQADDHNYAGGANYLSVNEARIEFFLLKNVGTQKATIKCRKKFEEEHHKIQKKYAGVDYVKEPIRATQQKAEFDEARKKYVNGLNCILQSITH